MQLAVQQAQGAAHKKIAKWAAHDVFERHYVWVLVQEASEVVISLGR